MGPKRYAALLRGINVGGRNKLAMSDLRRAFEDDGFERVGTYIQSGNVVFETTAPQRTLEHRIERLLDDHLQTPPVVVVRSHRQLRTVVEQAPPEFLAQADTHLRDCVFLKHPLTAEQTMEIVRLRDGVDHAWPGPDVVYFSRLEAQRTKTLMNKIVAAREYRLMTIRNWATTTKVLALLDGMGGPVPPVRSAG